MIEVSIARLRSRLAAILDAARAGEEIVIRRHGTRLAILTGFRTRAGTVRRSLSEPSKLPRAMDTGPVSPIRLRAKLRRSPAQELAEERE